MEDEPNATPSHTVVLRAPPVVILLLVAFAVVGGTAVHLVRARLAEDKSRTINVLHIDYHTGDCLMWDQSQADHGSPEPFVLDCKDPHIREVMGPVTITGEAHYPSEAEWQRLHTRLCDPLIERRLGFALDHNGRIEGRHFGISRESWAEGKRTMWCTVTVRQPDVALRAKSISPTWVGRAAKLSQTFLYPVGSCLQWEPEVGTVPCTKPHLFEVIGNVDVRKLSKVSRSTDQWEALTKPRCVQQLFAAYGAKGEPPDGLVTSILTITPEDWKAGRRTIQCIAGIVAKGDWLPVEHRLVP